MASRRTGDECAAGWPIHVSAPAGAGRRLASSGSRLFRVNCQVWHGTCGAMLPQLGVQRRRKLPFDSWAAAAETWLERLRGSSEAMTLAEVDRLRRQLAAKELEQRRTACQHIGHTWNQPDDPIKSSPQLPNRRRPRTGEAPPCKIARGRATVVLASLQSNERSPSDVRGRGAPEAAGHRPLGAGTPSGCRCRRKGL